MVAWPCDIGFCDTKFKVIIILVSNSLENYAYIESGIIIWFGYLSIPWEYKLWCIWDPLVNSVFDYWDKIEACAEYKYMISM